MSQSGTTRNTNALDDSVYMDIYRGKAQEKLAWGPSDEWSHNDFVELSEKISEASGLNISVTTVKRVWGKVKYSGAPTITTLNALASFLGYDSWRTFKMAQAGHAGIPPSTQQETEVATTVTVEAPGSIKSSKRKAPLLIALAAGVLLTLVLIYSFVYNLPGKPIDKAKAVFNSEPVTTGVPNTVIFNYDVSAFDFDSAFIQQNWDSRRRQRITKEGKQLTSVYYYPGHYRAKLVINNNIIREHGVLIPTDGWLGYIEPEKDNFAPTYFEPADLIREGRMQAQKAFIVAEKEQTTKDFSITYSNVRNFGVSGDDFTLETIIKNPMSEGGLTCQQSFMYLDCETGIISFPTSALGCVGSIGVEVGDVYISGKTADLSAFGADLDQWTKLTCVVRGKKAQYFINGRLVYSVSYKSPVGRIMGLNFQFHGAGAVDAVRLYDGQKNLAYHDDF